MFLWIIIGLIILFAIGVHCIDSYFDAGMTLTLISAILLLLIIIGWLVTYWGTKSNIQRYYAIKETIKISRQANMNDIERAALSNKIIEMNQWLKETQYWSNSFFKDWYPKEIRELKPLQ